MHVGAVAIITGGQPTVTGMVVITGAVATGIACGCGPPVVLYVIAVVVRCVGCCEPIIIAIPFIGAGPIAPLLFTVIMPLPLLLLL